MVIALRPKPLPTGELIYTRPVWLAQRWPCLALLALAALLAALPARKL